MKADLEAANYENEVFCVETVENATISRFRNYGILNI